MFDDVNTQVSNIAQQVGTKPSSFEPRVFAMIEALSRNVVLPIAGIILTFIACYELIEMITQHGLYALEFGDIFMRCLYRVRPYEKEQGSANALHEKWKKRVIDFVGNTKMLSHKKYKKMCREIIRDFDNLPMTDEVKPRVGVVGEILVKFLPAANNYVVDLLEAEGAEAVVPDLTDFLLYCCYNTKR